MRPPLHLQMDNVPGLTLEEVKTRQVKFGPNELDVYRPPGWWHILVQQCRSLLVYLLVAASIISVFLGDRLDAFVIWGAVLVNVLVGFIQEYRAQKSLSALRHLVRVEARVVRDGVEMTVDSRELVPGDLILVGAGSKVPADICLIKAVNLEVDEAVLTGESGPVGKKAATETEVVKGRGRETRVDEAHDWSLEADRLYMGTMVVRGQARGVVVATGADTKIGAVGRLLAETDEDRTPLQRQLDSLSKILVVGVLLISGVVFLLGVLAGDDRGVIFATGVALAVAAIPEGLVLAVTVTLVLGMRKILKRQALVKNLLAVDTLGATTVICTDKTGTLTMGKMTVVEVAVPVGKGKNEASKVRELRRTELKAGTMMDPAIQRLLLVGALCNEAVFEQGTETASWEVVGSPTEAALLSAAAEAGSTKEQLARQYPRLAEIPFESETQFMATFHRVKSKDRWPGQPAKSGRRAATLLLVKGSPERLEAMLGEEVDRRGLAKMTADGLRVLALAYRFLPAGKLKLARDDLKDLTLAGYVGLFDPLRPEAKEAIRRCGQAGLTAIMLTGDHRLTARAIARQLDIPAGEENVITGSELAKLSDGELVERIRHLRVYARVTPRDKIRIIDAWQAQAEVVAMTGDGVNDAPSLRSADIGVALGSGTDVAKETADIVLLDDNFNTIVSAIEGGRVVFDNIRKVTLYLLSDSFSEVLLVLGSLIFRLPLPLLPAQILYVNILTDGFPDIALTYEPEEREVMTEAPRGLSESIVNREMKLLIALISSFTGIGALALFSFYYQRGGDLELARTVVFAALGIDSLLYVFSVRSLRQPIWKKNPLENRVLLAAVAAGIGLQLGGIYFGPLQRILRTVPLNWFAWVLVLGQTGAVIVLIELVKRSFLKHRD